MLGAPATGKTSVLVRHVQRRIREGQPPDDCLVVGATRQSATRLRGAIGRGLGATHAEPLARSASSLAFAVLRIAAAQHGEPMPRLISGAEQDAVLRELLAGHVASGRGPDWPGHLAAALPTAGFRAQLRDLLMRAVEHGLGRADLERLGEEHDRPEWACAGAVLEEYDQVTALADPGSYDPAWICTAAADVLEDDPALRVAVRGRVGFLGVDDAQELTASAARLLDVVRPAGTDSLLVGDPDVAVQGFRGAVPGRFLELAHDWSRRDAVGDRSTTQDEARHVVVLRRRHGSAPAVSEVVDRVAARVGVVGDASQRRPEPGPGRGEAVVRLTRSPAQEAALVARWLRQAHLRDGVPWDELVVLARSGQQQDTVRRALAAGGVPVHVDRSAVTLGSDPALRPLLLAFDVVTRRGETNRWTVEPEEAVTLLSSPLGGLDPVGLRRLRRRLRAAELSVDGRRGADELIAAALEDPALRRAAPGDVEPELHPLVRLGVVLDAGWEAARSAPRADDGEQPAEGLSGAADAVLWALWDASGLAATWGEQALAGEPLGARADRDLDTVLVLFGAAESFVERSPGRRARSFLDEIVGTEVPTDTLVTGARRAEAVEVLTPHAAAGRRWERVAVVGVQDGVWPDLRLRDTLLGSEALVHALRGQPVAGQEAWRRAQAQVRADELRQFHVAVSRASQQILVTATVSIDEQPSALLDLVEPDFRDHPPVDVPPALTLRGLVGELRRAAARAQRDGDRATRDRATDLLLRLSDEGVVGADPTSWWSARDVSSTGPVQEQGPVRVSPSRVQLYLDCALRWFLTTRGADTGEAFGAELGTLVHDIVATQPDATTGVLWDELERRWPDCGLPAGWINERAQTDARRMLERYTTYVAQAKEEGRIVVGTELDLAVDLAPAQGEEGREVTLAGAVDRLERDPDDRLVVVDLKTGRSKPSAAEVEQHAQLAAYQVAVEEGAFAPDDQGVSGSGGARLVQLGAAGPVAQTQPPLVSGDDPQWARRMIVQVGEGMAAAEFTATDLDRRCRRCAARFACPLQPEGAQR